MVELTSSMILARTKFKNLSDVNKINFWGSQLSNINVIQKMPNLQVVSLSINEIDTLKDFSYCPKLEEIYIRKNKIADINEIVHLQNLKKLRILWLHDNPCDFIDNYRFVVLKMLPNLKKLDNVEVTPDEIKNALNLQIEPLNLNDTNLFVQSTRTVLRKTSQDSTINNKSMNIVEDDNLNVPNNFTSNYLHNYSHSSVNDININMNHFMMPRNDETTSDNDSQSSCDEDSHTNKIDNCKEKSNLHSRSNKSHNLLQATICLIRELSIDDLITVSREISQRLDKELQPNYIDS